MNAVFIIIILFLVGLIIGLIIDAEDCPRIVRGYDCRGRWCDHRKSVLYRAKMDEAIVREQHEAKMEREKMLEEQKNS